MKQTMAMKRSFAPGTVALILLASVACGTSDNAQKAANQAQTTPAASADGLPRTPWDGKPDMSGVWGGPVPANGTPGAAERRESNLALGRLYQPWALERTNSLPYTEDPRLHCAPYGFPRYMGLVSLVAPRKSFYFLLQIVQAPNQIATLIEYMSSSFRIIPTDGSSHPSDLAPTYFGDSRGRWEGDTLVVDVTGFNGKTWLAQGGINAPRGGGPPAAGGPPGAGGPPPHAAGGPPAGVADGGSMASDAMHLIERWRLVDKDTLEYQATVEDPKVLTGPWTTPKYRVPRAAPGTTINEALCIAPEDLPVIQASQKK